MAINIQQFKVSTEITFEKEQFTVESTVIAFTLQLPDLKYTDRFSWNLLGSWLESLIISSLWV